MGLSITSANSVLMLSVDQIYTTPQQIQGYSSDDAFETDEVENKEIQLGVDGLMSIGWLPTLIKLGITLQANSPSIPIFDTWVQTENQLQEVLTCAGSLTVPSLSKVFNLTQGALSKYVPIPPGKKVLMPQKFTLTFRASLAAPN